MVKHTQTIRRLLLDHFVGLAFKGLKELSDLMSYLEDPVKHLSSVTELFLYYNDENKQLAKLKTNKFSEQN